MRFNDTTCRLSLCKGKLFNRKVVFLLLCMCSIAIGVRASEIVDRIVAVVNDEIITYAALNEAFAPYEKQIQARNYSFAQEMEARFRFREQLIQQLIDQELTEQEANKIGIKISDVEVDEAIERTKSMNLITDEKLRKMLNQDGLTMEGYRKNMKQQLLRTRLIQYEVKSKIIITKEEIQTYYNANKSGYGEKEFADVETSITETLYQEQVKKLFQKWITDLRQNAHIKIIQ